MIRILLFRWQLKINKIGEFVLEGVGNEAFYGLKDLCFVIIIQ